MLAAARAAPWVGFDGQRVEGVEALPIQSLIPRPVDPIAMERHLRFVVSEITFGGEIPDVEMYRRIQQLLLVWSFSDSSIITGRNTLTI
ncbi:MAG: hypothetical protein R3C49_04615 [Planctomycetaceae bacterium]